MIVVIPPGTHWYLPHPWYDVVHWGLITLAVFLVLFALALVAWSVIDR